MMTVRLFFAGEGPDELGEWANGPAYLPSRDEPGGGGVLHAPVGRYARYETVAAVKWKAIRKFRAGDHAKPEYRNVMGLALQADERECDALAFVRDRDGDPEREKDIEHGIERASREFPVRIVGGTANEELEAWILAMLGARIPRRAGALRNWTSRDSTMQVDGTVGLEDNTESEARKALSCQKKYLTQRRSPNAVAASFSAARTAPSQR
jgi:hypothetical protein